MSTPLRQQQCAYCSIPAFTRWNGQPVCSMHYRRLRKYGDPDAVRTPGIKPTWPPRFLELIRQGSSLAAACAALGISRKTPHEYQRRHPDFAEQWQAAQAMASPQAQLNALIAQADAHQAAIHRLRAELNAEEEALIQLREQARAGLRRLVDQQEVQVQG